MDVLEKWMSIRFTTKPNQTKGCSSNTFLQTIHAAKFRTESRGAASIRHLLTPDQKGIDSPKMRRTKNIQPRHSFHRPQDDQNHHYQRDGCGSTQCHLKNKRFGEQKNIGRGNVELFQDSLRSVPL